MINKEIGLLKKVDLIITVSEREKRGLNNINNIVVWGHPVVVKNPENGFRERKDINLLHQPFTKDHHITLHSPIDQKRSYNDGYNDAEGRDTRNVL